MLIWLWQTLFKASIIALNVWVAFYLGHTDNARSNGLFGLAVLAGLLFPPLFCFPRPLAFIVPECDVSCALLVKIK